MAYPPTTWTNDSGEHISADNLNNIEQGIVAAARRDTAQTFTAPQRASINGGDNSIAFDDENNFSFTATAANITVTNQTIGQGGTLIIAAAENITGWSTEFDWGYQGVPTDLTGTETFGYFISGASGVDSIKIGRV